MKDKIDYTPARIRPTINTPFRVLVLFTVAVLTIIIVTRAS